ncbi:MAG TPA: response regulator, partial [Polyangiaceae bacterium]|nr:response regulator [Polyangiaceae bacterium]
MENPTGKSSVLIVDDTASNLLALSAVLSPLGVRVVQAQSGREALEHLRDEEFAVVLLDVQMPEMDGFELAARIRATDTGRELPIIFLTALHRDEAYVRRGYAIGAADYVTKPFDAEVLRARVKAFVDLFQQREAVRQAQVALRTRERDDAMRRALVFERIATAALETADLAEFLRELLQILLSVSEVADSATILLRNGDELEVRASAFADQGPAEERFRVRIGEGFAGRIAASRKPIELSDTSQPDTVGPMTSARGTRALFGVPLLSEGQVLGVAHVGSTRATAFTDRDKRLLLAVAERAAWAVSKHQERARVHGIVNAAPALIAIFRWPDYTVELANPTFEAFFGKATSRPLRPLASNDRRVPQAIAGAVEQAQRTGTPVSVRELPIAGTGEEPRLFNLTAQPLVGACGERD